MSTPDFFWSDERFHTLFDSTYSELTGNQPGQGRNATLTGNSNDPTAIPLQVAVYKADIRAPLPYPDLFFYQTAGKIQRGNAELGTILETIVELSNSPSGSPASVYSLFGRGIDVDSLNQKLYFVVYEIENFTSFVPNHSGDTSVFDSDNNKFDTEPFATYTCKIRRCDFDGSNLEDFETITRVGKVYEHIYYPSIGGFETVVFVEDFENGSLRFNNAHRDWTLTNVINEPIKEECYWSEWVGPRDGHLASIHKRNLLNSSSQRVFPLSGDIFTGTTEFCLDSHNRSALSGNDEPTIYIVDYYPLGGLPSTVGGEATSVPYYQISRIQPHQTKQVILFTGMKDTGDLELNSSFSHLHCLDMHYVPPKEVTDPQVNYDSALQLDPNSLYLTGAVLLGPPTVAPDDINLQYHMARIDVESNQYELIGNLGNAANGLAEGLSSFWNLDEVVDTVPQVDSLGATFQVGQARYDTVGSNDLTIYDSGGSVPSLNMHQSTPSGDAVAAGFNVKSIISNRRFHDPHNPEYNPHSPKTTWCRGESGVWAVSIQIPGGDGLVTGDPMGCIFELGSTNGGCYLGFNEDFNFVWVAGNKFPTENLAKVVVDGTTLPRDETIHLLCEIRDQSGAAGRVRIWMDSGDGYKIIGEAKTAGNIPFTTFSWAVNFNGAVDRTPGLGRGGDVISPELKQPASNRGLTLQSEVKYWPATLVNRGPHPPLAAWAAVRNIGVVPPLNNDALECSIQTTCLFAPENTKINRYGAGATGDITVAAWVYLLSTDDCVVVSKGSDGREYALYIKDKKPGIKLTDNELYPSTTETLYSVESPDSLETGRWYLLVGTIRKNNRIGISVDGRTRTSISSIGWGHLNKTPGDLMVGWNEVSTATWGYNFPGYIDQLSVWDRELADNEITDFYNNGLPATTVKHVRAFDINNAAVSSQRPTALKDTFWSGAQVNKPKLYLQSGQFSSTVVTSLAMPVFEGDIAVQLKSPSGIEWDGANTLWTDSDPTKRKLYKQSGVLTSTLKESRSVGLTNTNVHGISSLSNKSDTPWAGHKDGESSKLYLQSGQFTSTLKISSDVSSVDLKCNDITWAGPLSAVSPFPSTTGDALWSGGDGNKLYSVSGLFSSTIKDSQDVSNHDSANTGVSWDGVNTLWSGNETNKLLLMSGRFSRTVKTSVQVGAINDAPTGISTFDVDGRLSTGGASTYTGTGVIRDGLKSLTVAGTGQFSHTVPDTGEKVYITDYAATSSDALISTIDLDGFGRETVLTGPGDARDIVIDMGAKKIFWAEVSQNSVGTRTGAVHDAIFSADLAGNGKTELADIMANKRSDEVSASVVGLAIDKARERIFFMTRAVLSSPQADPGGVRSYPVRINLLVVNYDGTYNNQLGPHYFKIGNPLLRPWIQDPGRDDEMIPARMKYVEPSDGYPAGRLFYLTRTRTEAEDPGYHIGDSKNRYGSEILYIDLHTDEVTTCFQHGDNIRSFDVDVENNSIYLARHTYHPTTTITAVDGSKHDFPGWGEEPSADFTGIRSPKSRLERLDYSDNSFDGAGLSYYWVHKDSYLLQDYGGVGVELKDKIANFGNTPDSSAGNVTNQRFVGQIALAFQEWKDLFEQEFPGLILNFQDLGVETGLPPKMDVYGPDSSGQPNPAPADANVYDIPSGAYFGYIYDKVGDIRVGMHKFTAKSLVSGDTLAHGFPPQNLLDSLGSKGSFAGDLHFDVDDNWREDSGTEDAKSILYVGAHEVGHSLGFHHDTDQGALMAPSVKSSFANDIGHLVDSQAEIRAIQFLYGSDSPTPTNGSTQYLPRLNQWTKLRNAIKRLQGGTSTSETVTFTYSYMQARPRWVIEAIDNAYYSRLPIVVLASDVWDIPSDLTLDLDNEFIYVSDYRRGQVLRFDLDGSNRTALSPINIGDFSGLALLTAESNLYAGEGDLNPVGPVQGGGGGEGEPPETGYVEISGNAAYYSPFSSGGSDLEISKVSCDGAASYKNAPRLPKLAVAAIGKFTFVGTAKVAEATLPNLGASGQGTHTNPPSYDRPTDDIYYHNRNDSLVPRHGWNQSEFDNRYDTIVTCQRTQHAKDPLTPTDLVINDGCDLDKDSNLSVDIPVRNTNITTESPPNSSNLNASRAAKSVALMNRLNSQGLNTGRKSKLKRDKKKNES